MADLFISHSSRDGEFAHQLYAALVATGRDAWIYTHEVPALSEWRPELEQGIERADNFAFVITPSSVASKICRKELAHAAAFRKRLVPILRKPVNAKRVPSEIEALSWISFEPAVPFDAAFAKLQQALDTDLRSKRMQTELLRHARDWETSARSRSLLLRGELLASFSAWAASHPDAVVPLAQELLAASHAAERTAVRIRVAAGAIAAVLAIAAVVLFVARAHTAHEALVRQTLAAEEYAMRNGQLDTAQLLAAEAYEADPVLARTALYSAYTSAVNLQRTFHSDRNLTSGELSKDGRRLLTNGDDIRLWNAETGALIAILDPKTGELNRGLLSSDGARALTIGGHDRPRLWNAEAGVFIAIVGDTGADATFSPDARVVVTNVGTDPSADRQALQLWDSSTARLVGTIRVDAGAWRAIFSPDGRRVLVAGSRQPELWDLNPLQRVRSFEAPTTIWDGRFSPDGTLAVLDGQTPDSRSQHWLADLATGELTSLAIEGVDYEAQFCLNGRKLLLKRSGAPWLWDIATKKPDVRLSIPVSEDTLTSAILSKDGTRLFVRVESGTAQIWALEDVRLIATLHGRPEELYGAVFTSDDRVLTGSQFGSVLTWWSILGARLGIAVAHEGSISTWDYDETSDRILTVGSDATARIWKPFAHLLRTFPESDTTATNWSADGRHLLTVGGDTARIWDSSSGSLIGEHASATPILAAAPCADGGIALVGNALRDTVEMWDIVGHRQLALLKNPGATNIVNAEISAGCAHALLHDNSSGVSGLWELREPRLVAQFEDGGYTLSNRFSRDGHRILNMSLAADRIEVRDVSAGRIVGELATSSDSIGTSVQFAFAGRKVLLSDAKGTRLWDAETHAVRSILLTKSNRISAVSRGGRYAMFSDLLGALHEIVDLATGDVKMLDGDYRSAVFSDDERFVLINEANTLGGSVVIRQSASGQQVASIGSTGTEFASSLSPDGRLLAAGSGIVDVETRNAIAGIAIRVSQFGAASFNHPGDAVLFTGSGGELYHLGSYPSEREMPAAIRARIGRTLTASERQQAGLPAGSARR